MRALAIPVLLATAVLAAGCSTEHELTPLQSAAMRCKPSNIQRGEWPCQKAKDTPDEPLYCYRTLGAIECYAEPRPNQSAETRRQVYPPDVADPPPHRHR